MHDRSIPICTVALAGMWGAGGGLLLAGLWVPELSDFGLAALMVAATLQTRWHIARAANRERDLFEMGRTVERAKVRSLR